MSARREVELTRSPLVRRADCGPAGLRTPPLGHTEAELDMLIGLLTSHRPRLRTVTVGHGRDLASRAAAAAFVEAWQAVGGEVPAVVDWPEVAASWLRPARRFTAGAPDAWVAAGGVVGWAQLSRRLRHSTDWAPERTFGFGSLGDPAVVELAGADTVRGMSGASPDGGIWRIDGELISHYPPPPGRRRTRVAR